MIDKLISGTKNYIYCGICNIFFFEARKISCLLHRNINYRMKKSKKNCNAQYRERRAQKQSIGFPFKENELNRGITIGHETSKPG